MAATMEVIVQELSNYTTEVFDLEVNESEAIRSGDELQPVFGDL